MGVSGVIVDKKYAGDTAVLGRKGSDPTAFTGGGQALADETVEEADGGKAGFRSSFSIGMRNQAPASGFIASCGRTVDGLEGENAVDFAGDLGSEREEMGAGEVVVVPGIGFGVGADFGDQTFNVRILGIVGNDEV